ncbi:MAG: hypothetical protein E7291_07935 [Lachnospiraceae bacterium]|nr:hypothetical protein [Lachnospiraceae bacterium]
MKTITELTEEAENYFTQIDTHAEDIQSSYQHIISVLDDALSRQDGEALLQLIPYIEQGDGRFAFQHVGKTHRFHRMLHIIRLEAAFHQSLFSEGCTSARELWEKYSLTLFAMRRLLFCLSEESMAEAVHYLHNRPISYLAAFTIMQNELPALNKAFYETLAQIYEEIWSTEEIRQFYSLISSAQGGLE